MGKSLLIQSMHNQVLSALKGQNITQSEFSTPKGSLL